MPKRLEAANNALRVASDKVRDAVVDLCDAKTGDDSLIALSAVTNAMAELTTAAGQKVKLLHEQRN